MPEKRFIFAIILIVFFTAPFFAFGAVPEDAGIISLPNPLSAENFEALLDNVINWLLVVSAPLVALLIVYAGFMYMLGGVSPEQQKKAKNIVMYALLGYSIILLSKVFLGVITGLFS